MLPSRSSIYILLTLITASLNTNAELVRAKRLLFARENSSFGGWGLRADNCPPETQRCTIKGCCPKDMFCAATSDFGRAACCPTSIAPPHPLA